MLDISITSLKSFGITSRQLLGCLIFLFILNGCGGGGGDSSAEQGDPPPSGPEVPIDASFSEPLNGSFVNINQPSVEIFYTGGNGSIDLNSFSFTSGGQNIQMSCQLGTASVTCTPEQALSEGLLDLQVIITDSDGNTTTIQTSFYVDTQPVTINLTSPADKLVTAAEELEVAGTIGDGVVSVEVNGVPATTDVGTFTATVPIREGNSMLVAVAKKANGKTGSSSVEVTRDLIAPTVRINLPRDGLVSVNNTIDITGVVTDMVDGGLPTQVFVNGSEAMVANDSFVFTNFALARGLNSIAATAIDAVGNQSAHTISVTFEEPAGPRMTLASGNGQMNTVQTQLNEPLIAKVTDHLGNPLAGKVVNFEVSRNNGLLQASASGSGSRVLNVTTNGSGEAAAFFTLGDRSGEGNNRVRVTALGVAGEAEFCMSAIANAADRILMIGGDNQRGVIGEQLPMPLEAMVVDLDGNPISGMDVTFAIAGGTGSIDGTTTNTQVTDSNGKVSAILTLGSEAGINNNIVTAAFAGLTNSAATYLSSALAPGDPDKTSITGVILDNGHTPIPNVIVSIPGTTIEAATDSEGQFLLESTPVGHVTLHLDPSQTPRPETFPPMDTEMVTVAGQINNVGQPMLIPFINTENSAVVGGNQDVTIKMRGVEGLELKVFANSATFPDGSTSGQLTISQVHLDKVPMPPPNGMVFTSPAWTIQPAGVDFDPPAQVTIPNNGLSPGTVIDVFQFDHDLFEFVNIGKATVSEDGLVATTDTGFGVTHSGWGGGGPPPPPPICTCGCNDNNVCTIDSCSGQPSCVCSYKIKPDDEPCDDGLFCTDCSDSTGCQDGKCDCKPKPEGQLASHSFNFNLAKLLGPLKSFNKRLGDNRSFGLSFAFEYGVKGLCCEEKDSYETVVNGAGGGQVSLGVSLPILTPFPLKIKSVQFGIYFDPALSASAALTYDKQSCKDKHQWGGSYGTKLTASLSGVLKFGSAIDAKLTGTTGGSCSDTVKDNKLNCTFGHLGLVVSGEVEFLNGIISTAVSVVVISPSDGGLPVTYGLPLLN